MYFKVSIQTNPATGAPSGYYRLAESYRNTDGRVCHRTMLNVGFMEGVAAEDLNRIQKLINHKIQWSSNKTFKIEYEKESLIIQQWYRELYARLVHEKKVLRLFVWNVEKTITFVLWKK